MTEIDAVQFWLTQLSNLNETTVRNYKYYLGMFCRWVGRSPNELIEMKKRALEHEGDRRENMVLEGKLKAFMRYLKDDVVTQQGRRGYGLGTRKIAYSGIVSFFDSNQYPLSMKRGDRPSGEGIGSRIPEKEEIVRLVNAAKSRRHRAVILFLKDSGLRISDVVHLKWEDIKDFGDGFMGFKIVTRKRNVRALPFVGPETTEALNQLPRKKARIFPISAKYLSNAISEIIDEADVEPGLSPHGLRKYFNTEMEAARVMKEYRYAMMGKKISVYDENRQRNLFRIYRDAYDQLRVFGVVSQDEKIERLEDAIGERDEEIEGLKNRIQELEREKNKMKTRLNGVTLRDDQMQQLLKRIEKLEKQAQRQT